MPSLDEWLETWAEAKHSEEQQQANQQKFRCYNPIDAQSKYVNFDPAKGKADLKARYDVLGDNAQMEKSVCLIFIKYTGWVPDQCNCTDIHNHRRLGRLDYNATEHGHGVKHHGSTYEITSRQKELISKELRAIDSELYVIVKEIFKEQVEEIEQQYKISICDNFKRSAL
jgi:hypothetical protein